MGAEKMSGTWLLAPVAGGAQEVATGIYVPCASNTNTAVVLIVLELPSLEVPLQATRKVVFRCSKC